MEVVLAVRAELESLADEERLESGHRFSPGPGACRSPADAQDISPAAVNKSSIRSGIKHCYPFAGQKGLKW